MLGQLRRCSGDEHCQVRGLAEGGPDLLTVHDPFLAVLDGSGRETCQIRAGPRLAEELAPGALTGHDVAHVAVDLFLRAVIGDRGCGEHQPQAHGGAERTEGGDLVLHLDRDASCQIAPVGVGGQRRRRPPGETEPLPPLRDAQVGIPVVAQPVAQFVDDVAGGGCVECVGHDVCPAIASSDSYSSVVSVQSSNWMIPSSVKR